MSKACITHDRNKTYKADKARHSQSKKWKEKYVDKIAENYKAVQYLCGKCQFAKDE